MTEPTAEQPHVTATVSPAAPPRSRWEAIPRHLGRARTSTVVLSLLFLAIGALWINIRPDPGPVTTGTVVEEPTVSPVPAPPPPVPTPEPAPTTSIEPPTTTSEAPTTSSSAAPTPTETSTPVPTTTSEPVPLPDTTTSTPAG